MNRQECEFLIGCLLEDIRRVVKVYDEGIDLVSMYISRVTSSAWATTVGTEDNEREYLLMVNILQEDEENDADC